MKEYNEEGKTEQILREMLNPLPEAYKGEEAARYFVETLSECNLKCGLCAFGSREIFERKKGMMDLELFNKIIEKIALESPHAKVFPFHHCEPLLHPNLPEMVKIIKDKNLYCGIASNFNCSNRLEDLLKAGIDELSISVSGFYQETYQKSHVNGNIEKVKKNLCELREVLDCTGINPIIGVNYHMYKDNLGEEFDKMQDFCESLGFTFGPSWARSISVEMTLKYLREKHLSRYQGQTLQWFDEIPPLTKRYYDNIERIIYLPEDYLAGNYANMHGDECPMNYRDINIRWNGKVSFCCDAFDDRFMTFDYLSTPIKTLYEMRKQSPLCKECLENNYAFYSNYLDMPGIDKRAAARLDAGTPINRRFFAKIDPNEALYDFCMKHDHIFIFGAGGYGQKIATLLDNEKITFDCFLVSDEHISKYDNERIKPLSYLKNTQYGNAGIIVALNHINTAEVHDILLKTDMNLFLAAHYF